MKRGRARRRSRVDSDSEKRRRLHAMQFMESQCIGSSRRLAALCSKNSAVWRSIYNTASLDTLGSEVLSCLASWSKHTKLDGRIHACRVPHPVGTSEGVCQVRLSCARPLKDRNGDDCIAGCRLLTQPAATSAQWLGHEVHGPRAVVRGCTGRACSDRSHRGKRTGSRHPG